ncbi:carbohydrate ABC transporter permease [Marinicellulosiphila megalodicopiae]|uniref:carbohydrate ABC transporter permease n=1 Tax=Marinicellulosiphila megalodicopiae TaxID=2724896 RepID=UPI003BB06063
MQPNIKDHLVKIIVTCILLLICISLTKPFISHFVQSFYIYDMPRSPWQSDYGFNGLISQIFYSEIFFDNLWVSIKIASLGVLFSCLFCAMTAYALVMYSYKIKYVILTILLVVLMIPEFVKVMPFFITIKQLHLLNNHLALWIPFVVPPLGVLVIKQYIESLFIKEIIEAARLDGANEWQVFYKIMLPLLSPAISIVAIIQFTFFWNYIDLSVFIISETDKKPLLHIGSNGFPTYFFGSLSVIVPIIVLAISSRSITHYLKGSTI